MRSPWVTMFACRPVPPRKSLAMRTRPYEPNSKCPVSGFLGSGGGSFRGLSTTSGGLGGVVAGGAVSGGDVVGEGLGVVGRGGASVPAGGCASAVAGARTSAVIRATARLAMLGMIDFELLDLQRPGALHDDSLFDGVALRRALRRT